MTTPPKPKKPATVRQAEWILWAWIVWTCVLGTIQTWLNIPEIERALNDYGQGLISITPDGLMQLALTNYVTIAVVSGWVNYKIGQGRSWARSSMPWGLGYEALMAVVWPHDLALDYIIDIVDVGLLSAATYLLYRKASNDWFKPVRRPQP